MDDEGGGDCILHFCIFLCFGRIVFSWMHQRGVRVREGGRDLKKIINEKWLTNGRFYVGVS